MVAVTILQVSDLHFQADPDVLSYGQPSDANLDRVLAAVADLDVDAVAVTGDVAEDGQRASYERVVDRLHDRAATFRWVPGNHDDEAVMASVLDASAPASLGNWDLVPVNSVWPRHDPGNVAVAELNRVDAVLEQSEADHVLVMLHHPPRSPCSQTVCGLTNGDELLAVLDRHPAVRAVISGHQHRPWVLARNRVALLGAPSTCVQTEHDPHGFSDEPPACRVLRLHPDGRVDAEVVWAH